MSAIGLESGVPCIWTEKLKLAEAPEEMVCEVAPVGARVKSEPVVVPEVVPMPMIAGGRSWGRSWHLRSRPW